MLTDTESPRNYTYASTKSTAASFGAGLKSTWEWQKGDVLALFSPNSIDTPPVMWGCHWAGGIVTPANPGYTPDELAFQLKDSGAKAIMTQYPLLDVARKAAKMANIPEDRIALLGDAKDPSHKFKHFTSIRNISGATRYRRTKASAQDLAFLPYSSGTTGRPKGVMLTHANITSNVLMTESAEAPNLSPADSVIAFLPFFHIYGLSVMVHHAMHAGYQLLVMPRFDLTKFCATVQKEKVSFAYVAPPVVLLLSKSPIVDNYDLSSLRMMNSGAAPLTKELTEAMYARIKVPIKQGYGLTETSPTAYMGPWETWREKVGSVGLLLANQEAKYMSPEEKEVARGEIGELWVRGPNIFKGYLNNAEGTANALTADGYFKTGDVGYEDKDGYFYMTDRVKELIKYKGFQVPPAELEGLLMSHPRIEDAAVLGVYDEAQATEVPRAYLVPKGQTGGDELAKEITAWMKERTANHKHLRGGIRFIEEVPKSAAGKILRRVLKEQALKEDKRAKL